MTEETPDFSYRADMGFTHVELLKGLPSAVNPFRIVKRSDSLYEIADEERTVRLTLEPESVRKIASISLPVTSIKMDFYGFKREQFEHFMDRFKRYLQRGGG